MTGAGGGEKGLGRPVTAGRKGGVGCHLIQSVKWEDSQILGWEWVGGRRVHKAGWKMWLSTAWREP